MIYYIGTKVENIVCSLFDNFVSWILSKKIVGFDIETNVVPSILDRELIVLAFADKVDSWVLQWSYLTTEQKEFISKELNRSDRMYVIHSSTFEGTMMLKLGIILKNVWDTYSTEQILFNGKSSKQKEFDLASVLKARFDIDLSKDLQLSFGDDIMTYDKVIYSASDTIKLVLLKEIQEHESRVFDKNFPGKFHKGLRKTIWWENQFALVASDMEFEGLLIDQEKWKDCYNVSYPAMLKAQEELDKIVIEDFKNFAIENDWYSDEDRFLFTWGSTEKKKEILKLLFPNIEYVTILGLKEYLRDNDPDFPWIEDPKLELPEDFKPIEESGKVEKKLRKLKITGKEWERHAYPHEFNNNKYTVLKMLVLPNHDFTLELNKFFYKEFPEFMLTRGYVIPAGKLSFNWASSQQKLTLFQHINPLIDSTDKLSIENNLLTHRLFPIYEKYQEAASLVTKFGLDYLDHVQADGRIRTVFNRVLLTGRLSARRPNILQLPKESMYRASFRAPEGYKMVDADFDGQELCIIATLSKEEAWIETLSKGQDLHAVNAEIVLDEEWRIAAEPDCAYYKNKMKCKCKKHKPLRDFIKNLDFGLSYGLSAYGLAARQHVTKEVAQTTINKFFGKFPKVKLFLTRCGQFGMNNRFIYNSTLGRIRWFDEWKFAKYRDNNVYKNQAEIEEVIRQSSNFPVQSAGADILKIASVLLRRWIINNNMREYIKIVLPYHDQLLLYAKIGYENIAKERLEYYMRLAGKLTLKNNLLKATAKVSDFWIKD